MPISHEHEVIFIHVPKAAGTSVEFAFGMHGRTTSIGLKRQRLQRKDHHRLFGQGLQHLTLNEIHGVLLNRHFKDYGHLGSLKGRLDEFLSGIGQAPNSSVRLHNEELFRRFHKFSVVRNPFDRFLSHFFWNTSRWSDTRPTRQDFKEYVKQVWKSRAHETDLPNGGHLTPQTQFLTIDGVIAVDTLLRFEQLGEDFSALCDRLNVDLKLPHRMKSKKKKREDYFTQEEYSILAEMYAPDFEALGYAADDG